MSDAEPFSIMAPRKKGISKPRTAPGLGFEIYGPLQALSIHFCFESLHLWVTASPWKFVYREHIRKYFGTENQGGADVDETCVVLGGCSRSGKHSSRVRVCLNVRVKLLVAQDFEART